MSSARKIKFSVNGISGVGKRPTMHTAMMDRRAQNGKKGYYYEYGGFGLPAQWLRAQGLSRGYLRGWCRASLTAALVILIFAISLTTNFVSFGSERRDGMAMVFQSLIEVGKDLKYVDGISIENAPVTDEYLYSGGEEKEVLKLKFTSAGEIFRLKSLRVKVGGIDGWSRLVLKDHDGGEYRGVLGDGYANFENLYFKIDPENVLNLSFSAEFPDDLHFGQRVYFEIEDPRDVGLSLYGDEAHIKASYPLRGAYFTVVARKRVF